MFLRNSSKKVGFPSTPPCINFDEVALAAVNEYKKEGDPKSSIDFEDYLQ